MLWRPAYDTRRIGDLPAFSLKEETPGGAVLFVGGIEALPEFGVWVRLVEGDLGPEAWRGVLVGDARGFEESLPPSRLARCEIAPRVELPVELPVETGRVLAAVWSPGRLRGAMLGAATEEAWDEFAATMRAFRI